MADPDLIKHLFFLAINLIAIGVCGTGFIQNRSALKLLESRECTLCKDRVATTCDHCVERAEDASSEDYPLNS